MVVKFREFFVSKARARAPALGLLTFLILGGLFFVVHPVLAQATGAGGDSISHGLGVILGDLLLGITRFMGQLLLLITDVFLIPIASYNGFVTAKAVTTGWQIIRDLTNMFFVLMMLVISIGTILGVEEFSYRRLLPRLLIMAILINFSKVIVGIFIDFAQVLMLTFVNGFSAAAGGNIIQLFQLKEAITPSEAVPTGTALDIWHFVAAQLLALTMITIALFIVLVMCMMLAFRIVMLWILTILSPLAFFLSTFPRGKAHAAYSEWWSKFGNYVVSGPVLAFFLWLAFSITASGDLSSDFASSTVQETGNQFFLTEAGSEKSMVSFIIGIAMLLGGMYITADFGVAAGGMLRSGADWIKGTGQRLAKGAALLPLRASMAAGRGAVGLAGKGVTMGAKRAESTWFAKTGLYVPFSDRNQKRKKDLKEGAYKQRELQGLARREERMRKPYEQAAETAGKYSGKTKRLEEEREALFQPGQNLRASAATLRSMTGGNAFTMNADARRIIGMEKGELSNEMNSLQQQAAAATDNNARMMMQARAQALGRQVAALDRAVTNADGTEIEWASDRDLNATRATIGRRSTDLERRAQVADAAVQPQATYLRNEESAARKHWTEAENKALPLRKKLWRDPEYRSLQSAVGKAEDEARKNLPANMSTTDRQNALRDAYERKDKFQSRVLLKDMADKGELTDALTKSKSLGKNYSTDHAGISRFIEDFSRRFGMTMNETERSMSDVFNTASGKGETIFHGRIAQDVGTGAYRLNSEAKANISQAGKLDKMSVPELMRKNSVNAMFNVAINPQTNQAERVLSDAGLFKIAAAQDKIMQELREGRIHPMILEALKKNEAKLREAVQKGLLNQDFMDRLSQTIVRKNVTAEAMAKSMRGRV